MVPIELTIVSDHPIHALIETANSYIEVAHAPNTKRAYVKDWHHFETWCQSKGLPYLPSNPEVIALYLSDFSDKLKHSTLKRKMQVILKAHKSIQHAIDRQLIDKVWQGIKRTHGTHEQGKKPLCLTELKAMMKILNSESIKHIRDRALILIGFSGAFRRSELVSLNFEDILFVEEGIMIHLTKSKTDQFGQGRNIGIPYGSSLLTCPVRALKKWLAVSEIVEGAIFRPVVYKRIQSTRLSTNAIAEIIKKTLTKVFSEQGLSKEEIIAKVEGFAGHSLRAGFVTSAAKASVPDYLIMRQTGHKNAKTLAKYIRLGDVFEKNAAAEIGL